MQLTHKIALVSKSAQRDYFCRAAGTNRFTWNWGLAEWNRQHEAGLKPSAMRLKKQFNAIKYAQFPWLVDMHRDSHARLADCWYPSSKFCSACGTKNEALALSDRTWTCAACGTHHHRDHNAAINLQRLATVTALPAAKLASNGDTATGKVPAVDGKVTPVRHEFGQQDASGQEKNRAYLCAPS